jgi:membrane protease YdiL (CAAX protease family)
MEVSEQNSIKLELFSPFAKLLLLILLMMVGGAIGTLLTHIIGEQMGLSVSTLMETFDHTSSLKERNFLRLVNLISHLCSFTLPAIILVIMLSRNNWLAQLQLHNIPRFNFLLAGVCFLFAIFVLSQAAYWLNQQLPLPDWAAEMETSAEKIVRGLLVMDSTAELLFSVLVIAAVPAIGEELIFRGVVQQQLEKAFNNPAAAIWLSGFIFSVAHFQFAGLAPRFFLGVGLGYLFYWSQSLWMPILAHFLINASQIIAQRFVEVPLAEDSEMPINWGAVIVAGIMVYGLGYYLYRQFTVNTKPHIKA